MSKAMPFFNLAVILLVGYLCFAHRNFVTRALAFFIAAFLALNAYFFFEHAVLFRNKWQTATTGKRRTPPGQSVMIGSVLLTLALVGMYYCFHQ